MRTYTLNLSTNSKTNPPVQNNGLNTQASWNINWREIFGNKTGECRVRAVLQTLCSQPLPPTSVVFTTNSPTYSIILINWTGGLSQDGNPVTMTFQVNGTPTTPASVGTGTATFTGLTASTTYTIIVTATTSGGYTSNTLIVTTATPGFRYYKFEVVNTNDNGSSSFQGIQEIIIGYNNVKLSYTGATASDINNGGYTAEIPANAINGDGGNTSKWTTRYYSNSHPALIVDFQSNKVVNSYTYVTGYDSQPRDPISWIFYGSSDNTNWTTLDSRTITANSYGRSVQLPWYTF